MTPYTPYNLYNPYQPIQIPQQPQQPQQQQAPPQPQFVQPMVGDGIFFFVNGIDDVNSWIVQPGKSVFLFDRNRNTFYIKSVDINGMPKPIEICDYKKREDMKEKDNTTETSYVTREELELFKDEIIALIPKKTTTGRKQKQEVEEDE